MSYEVTLLVFGILLLLLGLVGKIKAKELEVGTSSTTVRVVTSLIGFVLITLSFNPDIPKSLLSSFTEPTKESEEAVSNRLADKQARLEEQRRAAEQARLEEQRRAAEQARLEEQRRAAEQARLELAPIYPDISGSWLGPGGRTASIDQQNATLTVHITGRPTFFGSFKDKQNFTVEFDSDCCSGLVVPGGIIHWTNGTTWTRP